MKRKKEKINSKIQKENCKININGCLIKCLQNLALCQLVNTNSITSPLLMHRRGLKRELVHFTACVVVWCGVGTFKAGVCWGSPWSSISWATALFFAHCVTLGESPPLSGSVSSFFICQMRRTTSQLPEWLRGCRRMFQESLASADLALWESSKRRGLAKAD